MKYLRMATAILATLGFFFVSTPVSARPEEHDIKRLVDTWDIPGAIETTRLFVRLAGERQKPIPVFTNSIEEMVEMKEKENGYYSHFLMNALLNWVRSDTMTPEQKSNAVYVALVGALTYPANWGDANLGISTLQELLVSSDVPETRVRAVEALATFGTGGFLQLNNEAEFIISQYFYETDSPADAKVNYQLKLILREHRPFVLRYGPGLVGYARCGIDVVRWGMGLMPVRNWFPGGYQHPRWYQPR